DEVDDELHLVQRLEVRRLGLVPGGNERLVTPLDELGEPPAQDDLLAEQVRLRLLLARRVEHTGAVRSDRAGVRERGLLRLACLRDRGDDQARGFGLRPRRRPVTQADAYVDAGLLQVQGVGMALRPVPEHRDLPSVEQWRVGVVVVVDRGGHVGPPLMRARYAPRSLTARSLVRSRASLGRAMRPVRCDSTIPNGSNRSVMASSLSGVPATRSVMAS